MAKCTPCGSTILQGLDALSQPKPKKLRSSGCLILLSGLRMLAMLAFRYVQRRPPARRRICPHLRGSAQQLQSLAAAEPAALAASERPSAVAQTLQNLTQLSDAQKPQTFRVLTKHGRQSLAAQPSNSFRVAPHQKAHGTSERVLTEI